MDDDLEVADERALRRQMTLFLFWIVGAAGLGALLLTSHSLLWAVPFLLGTYALYRYVQEPFPEDGGIVGGDYRK